MTAVDPDLSVDATFDSRNPATGAVIATYPVHGEAEIAAAVAAARPAAQWWAGLGFDGRRRRLKAFISLIARHQDELCEVIHAETGKPVDDALLEVLLVIDHLDWASRNAEKVLGRHRVPTTLNFLNHRADVEYLPMGVVGVIGPWNYPLHTPMGSITYALAAGNAVVYKPSEYTPGVGSWVVDAFASVVGEHPVLQLVTGGGATGAALCRSGVDVLAFTGSSRTGRKVMAACAERLTKVVMECGGKDALIVAADADLDEAAEAALWGGFMNAGQTCAGVERVFVDQAIYEPFVAKLVEDAAQVQVGHGKGVNLGPITMPSQIEVIRRHLSEALERGAVARFGGLESIRPPYVDPVVLTDVPDDAAVMREETFGPILPVVKVADMDDAVRRANDSTYGLGAAVFSAEHGVEIARRLDVGMVSVNSVLTFAALPALPFGGKGESGFGRIHGADGLREFTRPRGVTVRRLATPTPAVPSTFRRHPKLFSLIGTVNRLRHGRTR
jgi:acyl-CoA reductase-like NAD-dependent aldehyde dehydrogenase